MLKRSVPPPQAKGDFSLKALDAMIRKGEDHAAFRPAIDIVKKKRKLTESERKELAARIMQCAFAYRGMQSMMEEASKLTYHKLAAPLAEVIEILENKANVVPILIALLGAPEMFDSPDQEPVNEAAALYEAIVHGLHKIRANVPPPPPRRRRGKPKAHDLHRLVHWLATCWETFSGQEFTQLWDKGEPLSDGAQFVHAVVKVVDEKRLSSLPELTEQVVKRRKATSDK